MLVFITLQVDFCHCIVCSMKTMTSTTPRPAHQSAMKKTTVEEGEPSPTLSSGLLYTVSISRNGTDHQRKLHRRLNLIQHANQGPTDHTNLEKMASAVSVSTLRCFGARISRSRALSRCPSTGASSSRSSRTWSSARPPSGSAAGGTPPCRGCTWGSRAAPGSGARR
eukprot:SAG31_NODE_1756_length_7343_cov_2.790309_3_plen_167_part_00